MRFAVFYCTNYFKLYLLYQVFNYGAKKFLNQELNPNFHFALMAYDVQSLVALFKLARVLEKESPPVMVGHWSKALPKVLHLLEVVLRWELNLL